MAFVLNFIDQILYLIFLIFILFFCFSFFSLNLCKSKESQTGTCEKENNYKKGNTWKFFLTKVKPRFSEKPDCILKKGGSFFRKYFCHFISIYGQTFLKIIFSVLDLIDVVFCFLLLLEFSSKNWFPRKLLVLLKFLVSTDRLLFCPTCTWWMWLGKIVYIHW